ncbi:MAG: cupredoxin domain-containing protein [Nakamurella sp.]
MAQILLGAMSYLIPVVMGGGPAAVRATNRDLDAGGALRVSLTNLGLLVCVLPVPSLVRVIASVLVLTALASFVPLLLLALRRRRTTPADARGSTPRPRGQSTGLAVVGLALVMIAVAFGGSLDPASLTGPSQSAAGDVIAAGSTTTVTVEAHDMRFTPSRIEVPAGGRLVIMVKNTDRTDVHDLVLQTGHDTGRLAPPRVGGHRRRGDRARSQRLVLGGRTPADGHGLGHRGGRRAARRDRPGHPTGDRYF